MKSLPDGSVDLAFADPPFNIGFAYDAYDDRKSAGEYLDWCEEWIGETHRVLKPDGVLWIAIGTKFASELKIMSELKGFTCQDTVIWHYTFGVNQQKKFTPSYVPLHFLAKDPDRFTFNVDDPAVRVLSARQLVYNDKRANPRGRLPDNVWVTPGSTHGGFHLRPHDAAGGFGPDGNVWYVPRLPGNAKERVGWHGCQMPEVVLGRIIRFCSNPGDLVLDPFAGSGTTLAVAKKLGRRFIGFEISEQYVAGATARLDGINPGDPLEGVEDPCKSESATGKSATGKGRRSKAKAAAGDGEAAA